MVGARPQYKGQLEFVQIADFEGSTDFTSAVEGVDAIIHTASVYPSPALVSCLNRLTCAHANSH